MARLDARKLTKPRKLPRQERSMATVQAILQAAAQVFARHGYAGGTTNRIADAAGVSIGSVYEYFPNKDSILTALARSHMDMGLAVATSHIAAAANAGSLPAIVRGAIGSMIALHELDPKLHRVLFEESPLPGRLRRELTMKVEPLIEGLATLIAMSPETSTKNARLSASIIAMVVESLTHGFVLHPPSGVSRDEFIEESTKLVVDYLRSPSRG